MIKKNQRGITLIALIITIIVLLILAGVVISVSTSNTGIMDKAQEAKVTQEITTFKENVAFAQASLKTEIVKKKTFEPGYIATTSENFEELVEKVAKEFGVSANDIIVSSKSEKFKIASTQDVAIQSSPATIKQDGYTISSGLDIIGNSNTNGHGYITICYTSNILKSGINQNNQSNKYNLADEIDENSSEDQSVLVAIIHINNNNSELLTFETNDGNTTNYGLTSIENANEITGKKLKDTDYALYTKEYSKLTLNANDGTNTKTEQLLKVGNQFEIPTNPYNRSGYTFKNWNTKQDGTGNNYNPEDSENMTNAGIQLYACWEPIVYSINYDYNYGTATSNPSTYTIESNNITLIEPSKEGYYFTGWTGSNGNAPQKDVVISKGSIGNKTYTANYAQYTQASLRTFNPSDTHVSWSFDSATGIYTINQSARSSGWGDGVVCDNSTTDINWQNSYMLEFEIKLPNTYTLKTDGNTMFTSDGSGNDIYGTSWVILDDIRYDGSGNGSLPNSHQISGGTWHKVQMYLMNNNASQNPNHKAIRSFSGFGLDLSSVTSNVTYQIRNLKSIVY